MFFLCTPLNETDFRDKQLLAVTLDPYKEIYLGSLYEYL